MRTVSTPFTRETVSFSRTAARPSGPDGDFGPTDSMATLPLLESCRKARLKRPVELRCSVACTRDEDSLAAPGGGSSAPGCIGAVDSIAGYGMGSLCREGFAAAHTQARARTRCAVGSKSSPERTRRHTT